MATVAEYQTAINTIITNGQSFIVDGVSYNAASLETLRKLQADERAVSGRTNGTRPIFSRVNAGSAAY